MQPHVDVEASVHLRLVVADADAVPLPVSLRYSASDPYAVRAVFSGDGMEVEWVFARDLLRNGLTCPVGDGDVHVWPSWGTGRELLMISLTSPDGQAVLEAGGGRRPRLPGPHRRRGAGRRGEHPPRPRLDPDPAALLI